MFAPNFFPPHFPVPPRRSLSQKDFTTLYFTSPVLKMGTFRGLFYNTPD